MKVRCEKCGSTEFGTVETVPGLAVCSLEWVQTDTETTLEPVYDGWTNVDWNGQKSVTDGRGHVLVECLGCHRELKLTTQGLVER